MKRQKTYLLRVPALLRTPAYLLASALLLAGCSDSPDQPQPAPARVPIELHAAGEGVVSKAGTRTETGITHAFSTTVFATTGNGVYTDLIPGDSYKWMKNTTVQPSGALSLPDAPVYPDNDANIYLVAIAPQATTASYNSSDGTVTCTLDGQTDLMYAPQIAGNQKDGQRFSGNPSPTADKPLTYAHQLTQLIFKAKKTGSGTVTVKSLSVQAAPTATLTLSTGNIEFGGEAATMALELSNDAGIAVAGTGSTDLGALLLPPLDNNAEPYKVTVTTSDKTYSDLSIKFAPSEKLFVAGYSYAITLNFNTDPADGTKELEILSVSVSPWTTTEIGDLPLTE